MVTLLVEVRMNLSPIVTEVARIEASFLLADEESDMMGLPIGEDRSQARVSAYLESVGFASIEALEDALAKRVGSRSVAIRIMGQMRSRLYDRMWIRSFGNY